MNMKLYQLFHTLLSFNEIPGICMNTYFARQGLRKKKKNHPE